MIKIVMIMVVVLMTTGTANADFYILNDKASPPLKNNKMKKDAPIKKGSGLTTKGLQYFEEGIIAGRGNQVSFEIFKQQVLPDGYQISCERCPKTISWASDGEPWEVIAKRALPNHRLNLDKPKRSISFIPVRNGKQLWFVNKGETAEQTLSRWVRKAGYNKLVWAIDRQFKMDVDHSYASNNIKEVVSEFMASMKRTTNMPVKALFYRNKVIKIIYFGEE